MSEARGFLQVSIRCARLVICHNLGFRGNALCWTTGPNETPRLEEAGKPGRAYPTSWSAKILAVVSAALWFAIGEQTTAQNRYATSDSMSGYVHWIDLYDASNTRIDPRADNPPPYSPEKTCGRCHDFKSIAHGWHFNSVDPQAEHGRPGQPWIWSDHRTGTHLPLSYRGWLGTHHPDVLGLTRWQMAAKFGGFLPGGGVGSLESLSSPAMAEVALQAEIIAVAEDRTPITGALPVDCLLCHRTAASGYSPFVWTEQIESKNFAYAPTAALGIAEIRGTMARLKNFDPTAENASAMLPQVSYDLARFRSDGKVFIDLVRKPLNNACYYCHTNVEADTPTGQRWLHDEDIHITAGLSCADCHRNGLNHNTVRGYENERHIAGTSIASLSCQGCHLGSDRDSASSGLAGRLGAPRPAHRGLPPLHFEKMSCTACHSGSLPQPTVGRLLNSIAHRLGEHVKRTGEEFPAIIGPVIMPTSSLSPTDAGSNSAESEPGQAWAGTDQYTPHRIMWPSYWAEIRDGKLTVLNPEVVYELIRKPLRVTRDFTGDLGRVSLSLSERKELLGEERARVKETDRTPQEAKLVEEAEARSRQKQVTKKMAAALTAIEDAHPGVQAIYIAAGVGLVLAGETSLKELSSEELSAFDSNAAQPYAWPLAHNVRPARQSLGVNGCTECHSDGSLFFNSDILPVGLLPDQVSQPIKAYAMQNADMSRLRNWNKLFAGRANFKLASLAALVVTCVITISALVWNLGSFLRRTQ